MRRIVALAAVLVVSAPVWASAQDEPKDIVDTAVAAGGFETLVKAAQAADLVDTLRSPGPYTVFAPTDEAFAKLPEGTVAELLKPENKAKLAEILKYHVVPGEVPAAEVVNLDGQDVTTAQGQPVKVGVKDGTVSINDAKVLKTDIAASNGLIHVIDSVLLPPAPAAAEAIAAAPAQAAPAAVTGGVRQAVPMVPGAAPSGGVPGVDTVQGAVATTVGAAAETISPAAPAAVAGVAMPAAPAVPGVVGTVPAAPAVPGVAGAMTNVRTAVPTVPSSITGGSLIPGAPAIPGVTSIPGVPGIGKVPGVPSATGRTGGFFRRLNPFRNRRLRHAAGY